ncbi:MAG: hypothetical protein WD154_01780 [Nitrosopumilaceae archaeon]
MPDKDKIEYPDELACYEIEAYLGLRMYSSLARAKKYADKIRGQIYTQVDGDGDILYSKGIRFVNRTGIYAVIR